MEMEKAAALVLEQIYEMLDEIVARAS